MALTLEEFTQSLDPKSLPRVIQIQSGIYFQGSVYEMFGRECCLPTGEIIKVIGLSIAKLTAEIQKENITHSVIDLPLHYPGLFQIVADKKAYLSVGDILESLRNCPDRLGQPVFKSTKDIQLADGTIKEGEKIILTSLTKDNSEEFVNCKVIRKDKMHIFTLPKSQEGEFYECEDDQFYTLKEITEWKMPKGRKRTVNLANSMAAREMNFFDLPENFKGELILSPVYELQAVMKYRKDIVHIPSSLDVEVIDVTDKFDINCFVLPLTPADIFKRPPEEFPIIAEIIEGPEQTPDELHFLRSCNKVIVHRAYEVKLILASEIRSDVQRHFLIPFTYKGKFKRRPREFPTAYNLEIAKRDKEQLHVVATKAFESHYEGLATVFVGDQFLVQKRETSEVIYGETCKMVEALACEKIEGKKYEPVLIPMCLEGGFVEVIHDKKQYNIFEICEKFPLPFNVKVSVRDLSIKEDILAAIPGLHLEEEITDPYLLITSLDLSECWEVPVNRIKMSLQLLHKPEKQNQLPLVRTLVEEISEDHYYTLRRYITATLCPPPRPPKKPMQPLSKALKLEPPQPRRSDAPSSPKSPHVNIPRPTKPVSPGCVERHNAAPECDIKAMPNNLVVVNSLQRASSSEKCAEECEDSNKHDYEYIEEDELDKIRQKFQKTNINDNTNCKKNEGNQYEHSVSANNR
ncbi:protein THEMIS [Amia ocellicauda]|uniref:protein THEMIS n=1 Tax=Amia ocellicauda TaxID=2972642 RepID=UPI003463B126